jgi:hypothetical protein
MIDSCVHSFRQRSVAACLVASLCVLASACGQSGPAMGRVSGTVTYQGKPVTAGTVSFISTDTTRPNANGKIGADGSYTLQTTEPGDGAQVGDYKIVVSGKNPDELNNPLPGAPIKVKSALPSKYENPDTSELKATVAPGSQTIPIELK